MQKETQVDFFRAPKKPQDIKEKFFEKFEKTYNDIQSVSILRVVYMFPTTLNQKARYKFWKSAWNSIFGSLTFILSRPSDSNMSCSRTSKGRKGNKCNTKRWYAQYNQSLISRGLIYCLIFCLSIGWIAERQADFKKFLLCFLNHAPSWFRLRKETWDSKRECFLSTIVINLAYLRTTHDTHDYNVFSPNLCGLLDLLFREL